jgi:superfamily II DNA/RNA helicase
MMQSFELFFPCVSSAVTLQNTISSKGYKVTAIHGDKSQADRTAALEEFKSGRTPLMIATDVAVCRLLLYYCSALFKTLYRQEDSIFLK